MAQTGFCITVNSCFDLAIESMISSTSVASQVQILNDRVNQGRKIFLFKNKFVAFLTEEDGEGCEKEEDEEESEEET